MCTNQKVCYCFFVDDPLFGANAGFQRCVNGFQVNASRYKLTGLDRLVY